MSRLLRSAIAALIAACLFTTVAEARQLAGVTDIDIQRLQDSVYLTERDVAQLRTRDAGRADSLQAELDELRDEVIYLKVKLRKERGLARTEYNDVRDRIDAVRVRTRPTPVTTAAPAPAPAAPPAPVTTAPAPAPARTPAPAPASTAVNPRELPSGTEFDVRWTEQRLSVVLFEGRVSVLPETQRPSAEGISMQAGERLYFAQPALAVKSSSSLDREEAWIAGRAVFENRRLLLRGFAQDRGERAPGKHADLRRVHRAHLRGGAREGDIDAAAGVPEDRELDPRAPRGERRERQAHADHVFGKHDAFVVEACRMGGAIEQHAQPRGGRLHELPARIGEAPRGRPNNLVPLVSRTAYGEFDEVPIFGNDWPTPDGTGVRDYLHVDDLAEGHVAALAYLATHQGEVTLNLGVGRGYSVLEVIAAFERACGRKVTKRFAPRREGDVACIYADPSRAHALLGWQRRPIARVRLLLDGMLEW
jgi:hypothetical protein